MAIMVAPHANPAPCHEAEESSRASLCEREAVRILDDAQALGRDIAHRIAVRILFWQRARYRNRETAAAPQRLGLPACYRAGAYVFRRPVPAF